MTKISKEDSYGMEYKNKQGTPSSLTSSSQTTKEVVTVSTKRVVKLRFGKKFKSTSNLWNLQTTIAPLGVDRTLFESAQTVQPGTRSKFKLTSQNPNIFIKDNSEDEDYNLKVAKPLNNEGLNPSTVSTTRLVEQTSSSGSSQELLHKVTFSEKPNDVLISRAPDDNILFPSKSTLTFATDNNKSGTMKNNLGEMPKLTNSFNTFPTQPSLSTTHKKFTQAMMPKATDLSDFPTESSLSTSHKKSTHITTEINLKTSKKHGLKWLFHKKHKVTHGVQNTTTKTSDDGSHEKKYSNTSSSSTKSTQTSKEDVRISTKRVVKLRFGKKFKSTTHLWHTQTTTAPSTKMLKSSKSDLFTLFESTERSFRKTTHSKSKFKFKSTENPNILIEDDYEDQDYDQDVAIPSENEEIKKLNSITSTPRLVTQPSVQAGSGASSQNKVTTSGKTGDYGTLPSTPHHDNSLFPSRSHLISTVNHKSRTMKNIQDQFPTEFPFSTTHFTEPSKKHGLKWLFHKKHTVTHDYWRIKDITTTQLSDEDSYGVEYANQQDTPSFTTMTSPITNEDATASTKVLKDSSTKIISESEMITLFEAITEQSFKPSTRSKYKFTTTKYPAIFYEDDYEDEDYNGVEVKPSVKQKKVKKPKLKKSKTTSHRMVEHSSLQTESSTSSQDLITVKKVTVSEKTDNHGTLVSMAPNDNILFPNKSLLIDTNKSARIKNKLEKFQKSTNVFYKFQTDAPLGTTNNKVTESDRTDDYNGLASMAFDDEILFPNKSAIILTGNKKSSTLKTILEKLPKSTNVFYKFETEAPLSTKHNKITLTDKTDSYSALASMAPGENILFPNKSSSIIVTEHNLEAHSKSTNIQDKFQTESLLGRTHEKVTVSDKTDDYGVSMALGEDILFPNKSSTIIVTGNNMEQISKSTNIQDNFQTETVLGTTHKKVTVSEKTEDHGASTALGEDILFPNKSSSISVTGNNIEQISKSTNIQDNIETETLLGTTHKKVTVSEKTEDHGASTALGEDILFPNKSSSISVTGNNIEQISKSTNIQDNIETETLLGTTHKKVTVSEKTEDHGASTALGEDILFPNKSSTIIVTGNNMEQISKPTNIQDNFQTETLPGSTHEKVTVSENVDDNGASMALEEDILFPNKSSAIIVTGNNLKENPKPTNIQDKFQTESPLGTTHKKVTVSDKIDEYSPSMAPGENILFPNKSSPIIVTEHNLEAHSKSTNIQDNFQTESPLGRTHKKVTVSDKTDEYSPSMAPGENILFPNKSSPIIVTEHNLEAHSKSTNIQDNFQTESPLGRTHEKVTVSDKTDDYAVSMALGEDVLFPNKSSTIIVTGNNMEQISKSTNIQDNFQTETLLGTTHEKVTVSEKVDDNVASMALGEDILFPNKSSTIIVTGNNMEQISKSTNNQDNFQTETLLGTTHEKVTVSEKVDDNGVSMTLEEDILFPNKSSTIIVTGNNLEEIPKPTNIQDKFQTESPLGTTHQKVTVSDKTEEYGPSMALGEDILFPNKSSAIMATPNNLKEISKSTNSQDKFQTESPLGTTHKKVTVSDKTYGYGASMALGEDIFSNKSSTIMVTPNNLKEISKSTNSQDKFQTESPLGTTHKKVTVSDKTYGYGASMALGEDIFPNKSSTIMVTPNNLKEISKSTNSQDKFQTESPLGTTHQKVTVSDQTDEYGASMALDDNILFPNKSLLTVTHNSNFNITKQSTLSTRSTTKIQSSPKRFFERLFNKKTKVEHWNVKTTPKQTSKAETEYLSKQSNKSSITQSSLTTKKVWKHTTKKHVHRFRFGKKNKTTTELDRKSEFTNRTIPAASELSTPLNNNLKTTKYSKESTSEWPTEPSLYALSFDTYDEDLEPSNKTGPNKTSSNDFTWASTSLKFQVESTSAKFLPLTYSEITNADEFEKTQYTIVLENATTTKMEVSANTGNEITSSTFDTQLSEEQSEVTWPQFSLNVTTEFENLNSTSDNADYISNFDENFLSLSPEKLSTGLRSSTIETEVFSNGKKLTSSTITYEENLESSTKVSQPIAPLTSGLGEILTSLTTELTKHDITKEGLTSESSEALATNNDVLKLTTATYRITTKLPEVGSKKTESHKTYETSASSIDLPSSSTLQKVTPTEVNLTTSSSFKLKTSKTKSDVIDEQFHHLSTLMYSTKEKTIENLVGGIKTTRTTEPVTQIGTISSLTTQATRHKETKPYEISKTSSISTETSFENVTKVGDLGTSEPEGMTDSVTQVGKISFLTTQTIGSEERRPHRPSKTSSISIENTSEEVTNIGNFKTSKSEDMIESVTQVGTISSSTTQTITQEETKPYGPSKKSSISIENVSAEVPKAGDLKTSKPKDTIESITRVGTISSLSTQTTGGEKTRPYRPSETSSISIKNTSEKVLKVGYFKTSESEDMIESVIQVGTLSSSTTKTLEQEETRPYGPSETSSISIKNTSENVPQVGYFKTSESEDMMESVTQVGTISSLTTQTTGQEETKSYKPFETSSISIVNTSEEISEAGDLKTSEPKATIESLTQVGTISSLTTQTIRQGETRSYGPSETSSISIENTSKELPKVGYFKTSESENLAESVTQFGTISSLTTQTIGQGETRSYGPSETSSISIENTSEEVTKVGYFKTSESEDMIESVIQVGTLSSSTTKTLEQEETRPYGPSETSSISIKNTSEKVPQVGYFKTSESEDMMESVTQVGTISSLTTQTTGQEETKSYKPFETSSISIVNTSEEISEAGDLKTSEPKATIESLTQVGTISSLTNQTIGQGETRSYGPSETSSISIENTSKELPKVGNFKTSESENLAESVTQFGTISSLTTQTIGQGETRSYGPSETSSISIENTSEEVTKVGYFKTSESEDMIESVTQVGTIWSSTTQTISQEETKPYGPSKTSSISIENTSKELPKVGDYKTSESEDMAESVTQVETILSVSTQTIGQGGRRSYGPSETSSISIKNTSEKVLKVGYFKTSESEDMIESVIQVGTISSLTTQTTGQEETKSYKSSETIPEAGDLKTSEAKATIESITQVGTISSLTTQTIGQAETRSYGSETSSISIENTSKELPNAGDFKTSESEDMEESATQIGTISSSTTQTIGYEATGPYGPFETSSMSIENTFEEVAEAGDFKTSEPELEVTDEEFQQFSQESKIPNATLPVSITQSKSHVGTITSSMIRTIGHTETESLIPIKSSFKQVPETGDLKTFEPKLEEKFHQFTHKNNMANATLSESTTHAMEPVTRIGTITSSTTQIIANKETEPYGPSDTSSISINSPFKEVPETVDLETSKPQLEVLDEKFHHFSYKNKMDNASLTESITEVETIRTSATTTISSTLSEDMDKATVKNIQNMVKPSSTTKVFTPIPKSESLDVNVFAVTSLTSSEKYLAAQTLPEVLEPTALRTEATTRSTGIYKETNDVDLSIPTVSIKRTTGLTTKKQEFDEDDNISGKTIMEQTSHTKSSLLNNKPKNKTTIIPSFIYYSLQTSAEIPQPIDLQREETTKYINLLENHNFFNMTNKYQGTLEIDTHKSSTEINDSNLTLKLDEYSNTVLGLTNGRSTIIGNENLASTTSLYNLSHMPEGFSESGPITTPNDNLKFTKSFVHDLVTNNTVFSPRTNKYSTNPSTASSTHLKNVSNLDFDDQYTTTDEDIETTETRVTIDRNKLLQFEEAFHITSPKTTPTSTRMFHHTSSKAPPTTFLNRTDLYHQPQVTNDHSLNSQLITHSSPHKHLTSSKEFHLIITSTERPFLTSVKKVAANEEVLHFKDHTTNDCTKPLTVTVSGTNESLKNPSATSATPLKTSTSKKQPIIGNNSANLVSSTTQVRPKTTTIESSLLTSAKKVAAHDEVLHFKDHTTNDCTKPLTVTVSGTNESLKNLSATSATPLKTSTSNKQPIIGNNPANSVSSTTAISPKITSTESSLLTSAKKFDASEKVLPFTNALLTSEVTGISHVYGEIGSLASTKSSVHERTENVAATIHKLMTSQNVASVTQPLASISELNVHREHTALDKLKTEHNLKQVTSEVADRAHVTSGNGNKVSTSSTVHEVMENTNIDNFTKISSTNQSPNEITFATAKINIDKNEEERHNQTNLATGINDLMTNPSATSATQPITRTSLSDLDFHSKHTAVDEQLLNKLKTEHDLNQVTSEVADRAHVTVGNGNQESTSSNVHAVTENININNFTKISSTNQSPNEITFPTAKINIDKNEEELHFTKHEQTTSVIGMHDLMTSLSATSVTRPIPRTNFSDLDFRNQHTTIVQQLINKLKTEHNLNQVTSEVADRAHVTVGNGIQVSTSTNVHEVMENTKIDNLTTIFSTNNQSPNEITFVTAKINIDKNEEEKHNQTSLATSINDVMTNPSATSVTQPITITSLSDLDFPSKHTAVDEQMINKLKTEHNLNQVTSEVADRPHVTVGTENEVSTSSNVHEVTENTNINNFTKISSTNPSPNEITFATAKINIDKNEEELHFTKHQKTTWVTSIHDLMTNLSATSITRPIPRTNFSDLDFPNQHTTIDQQLINKLKTEHNLNQVTSEVADRAHVSVGNGNQVSTSTNVHEVKENTKIDNFTAKINIDKNEEEKHNQTSLATSINDLMTNPNATFVTGPIARTSLSDLDFHSKHTAVDEQSINKLKTEHNLNQVTSEVADRARVTVGNWNQVSTSSNLPGLTENPSNVDHFTTSVTQLPTRTSLSDLDFPKQHITIDQQLLNKFKIDYNLNQITSEVTDRAHVTLGNGNKVSTSSNVHEVTENTNVNNFTKTSSTNQSPNEITFATAQINLDKSEEEKHNQTSVATGIKDLMTNPSAAASATQPIASTRLSDLDFHSKHTAVEEQSTNKLNTEHNLNQVTSEVADRTHVTVGNYNKVSTSSNVHEVTENTNINNFTKISSTNPSPNEITFATAKINIDKNEEELHFTKHNQTSVVTSINDLMTNPTATSVNQPRTGLSELDFSIQHTTNDQQLNKLKTDQNLNQVTSEVADRAHVTVGNWNKVSTSSNMHEVMANTKIDNFTKISSTNQSPNEITFATAKINIDKIEEELHFTKHNQTTSATGIHDLMSNASATSITQPITRTSLSDLEFHSKHTAVDEQSINKSKTERNLNQVTSEVADRARVTVGNWNQVSASTSIHGLIENYSTVDNFSKTSVTNQAANKITLATTAKLHIDDSQQVLHFAHHNQTTLATGNIAAMDINKSMTEPSVTSVNTSNAHRLTKISSTNQAPNEATLTTAKLHVNENEEELHFASRNQTTLATGNIAATDINELKTNPSVIFVNTSNIEHFTKISASSQLGYKATLATTKFKNDDNQELLQLTQHNIKQTTLATTNASLKDNEHLGITIIEGKNDLKVTEKELQILDQTTIASENVVSENDNSLLTFSLAFDEIPKKDNMVVGNYSSTKKTPKGTTKNECKSEDGRFYINLPIYPQNSTFPIMISFEKYYSSSPTTNLIDDDEETDTVVYRTEFRTMKLEDFNAITEYPITTPKAPSATNESVVNTNDKLNKIFNIKGKLNKISETNASLQMETTSRVGAGNLDAQDLSYRISSGVPTEKNVGTTPSVSDSNLTSVFFGNKTSSETFTLASEGIFEATEFFKFAEESTCNYTDFIKSNHCVCSMDNLLKDLREKLAKNQANLIMDNNYTCPILTNIENGIVLSNNSIPKITKSRRSINGAYSIVFRRETVENQNIEKILNEQLELINTDNEIFATPGMKIQIPCMYSRDTKEVYEIRPNYTWTFLDNMPITEGKIQESEGILNIENITPQDGGNYTCAVTTSVSDRVKEKKYEHLLTVVNLPSYALRTSILYNSTDKCDPGDVDILSLYLPKAVEKIMCGNHFKICSVEVKNPKCINSNKNTAVNVSVIVEPMSVMIPSVNTTSCDVSCEMKIYSQIVLLLLKNLQAIQKLPLIFRLSYREHTLLPTEASLKKNKQARFASQAPKLIVTCPPGFGYFKRTHICGACGRNTFSKGDQTFCSPCPAGQYQPMVGSKSCLQCATPLQDPYCLRVMYSNTHKFRVLVGIAASVVIALILLLICLRNMKKGTKNNRNFNYERDPYYKNKRRSKRRYNRDDPEKQDTEPLISKERRRNNTRVPPEPPPPDF